MFSLHKRSEVLILLMLLLSVSLYGLDYFLFGPVRDIGFGFLGNLAFLPIYVLFVTFMIERILKEREKDVLRQKMKMGSRFVKKDSWPACLSLQHHARLVHAPFLHPKIGAPHFRVICYTFSTGV